MFKKIFQMFKQADFENEYDSLQPEIIEKKEFSAREMLKEAARLKKAGKIEEACQMLVGALLASDSEELMLKERLRLPMYLQSADKSDEGWQLLNELNVKYTDNVSQYEIADQMRIFLTKEKNYKQAIVFAIWAICKRVEDANIAVKNIIKYADKMSNPNSEISGVSREEKEIMNMLDGGRDIYGYTPSGNPIHDRGYSVFEGRVKELTSIQGVNDSISTLIKKAKFEEKADLLSKSIVDYLNSKNRYEFIEVRQLLDL